MDSRGSVGPAGNLFIRAIRTPEHVPSIWPTHTLSLREIAKYGYPQKWLPRSINEWRKSNLPNLVRGLPKVVLARKLHIPSFYGQLFLTVIRKDGEIEELGLAGLRMVTTAGVRFICDDFNASSTDISTMLYHGIGVGVLTEAVTNTALTTELTTEYIVNNTRATGSQASATAAPNATYTTVGTNTVDSAVALIEHGIFSQAATGGGTLLDGTAFAAVNLASGDSLQSTYVFTMNAGG